MAACSASRSEPPWAQPVRVTYAPQHTQNAQIEIRRRIKIKIRIRIKIKIKIKIRIRIRG
eukprot:SAG31_NODE_41296_length_276_cov_2.954802_1_plen_60_part_00